MDRESEAPDVDQVVRDWVEEALLRVAEELPGAVAFSIDDVGVAATVAAVRDAISRPPSKGSEEDMGDEGLANSPFQHAIDLLRKHLLDCWPNDDFAFTSERLNVLRTLERIREAIAPPWVRALSPFSAANGGELVVQLAHDLRSPLTSILFLAETLSRGQSGELNEQQKRQIGLIYAAALGLASISGDVMELARGGEGLVENQPNPFSVGEIFDAVKNMVLPLAEEKQLELLISNPASDHWSGHPLALSRVLLNLTTNALKFTDTGSVEIGARATGLSSVEFWVKDTGRGIPDHAKENLFKMFRPMPSRGRNHFSGTGLGLHICQQLVRAMGSQLLYETEEEKGTRFYFELRLNSAVRI